MEIVEVARQLHEKSEMLKEAIERLYKSAQSKVDAERVYRVEYARALYDLRQQGHPSNMVHDMAKAKVSNLLYDYLYTSEMHKALVMEIDALKTTISALQSVNRYMDQR